MSFPPHHTMDECLAKAGRYNAKLGAALAGDGGTVFRGRVLSGPDIAFGCVGQEDGLAR